MQTFHNRLIEGVDSIKYLVIHLIDLNRCVKFYLYLNLSPKIGTNNINLLAFGGGRGRKSNIERFVTVGGSLRGCQRDHLDSPK